MLVNTYEGLFIFDSNRYARDPAGVAGQVAEAVRRNGGELLVSRLWEERRLAYPIKGHRKGTYWLTYFRMEGRKLADLDRDCRLNDVVLRHLFVKIDARIADAVVQHALAGHQVKARGSQGMEGESAGSRSATAVGVGGIEDLELGAAELDEE